MPCCTGKASTNVKSPQPVDKIPDSSSGEKLRQINPVMKPAGPSKIEYTITVKTGNYRNSGTNGPVYLKIFGRDNQQTEDILLKTSSNEKFFSQESTRKFQIQAIDVGKPQRIILRHENKGSGWYIDYVDVSVHDFLIRFFANRWLDETKHDRKLSVELFGTEQPAVNYNIEVYTGSEQTEPLDSPVYIQIFGTVSTTPKIFLESKNSSFTKDSQAKFNVDSNNVGQIEKIIIGHEGLGTVNDWFLQSVKVQIDSEQQTFLANRWLSPTKDDKKLFVELTRRAPSPPRNFINCEFLDAHMFFIPHTASMYMVTVRTGDVPHNEIAENVQISIRGANGEVEKVLLKEHWKSDEQQKIFQQGKTDQFEIKHADIGQIESLTIGFDDPDQRFAWMLDAVEINFQGRCWLSSRLGQDFSWITIKPEANNDDITYKTTIITGESGIGSNVILCIYGETNVTKNFALTQTMDDSKARFDQNSQLQFDLKATDVGKITKINIGHDGQDEDQQWSLEAVRIEKKDEQYTFKADRCLKAKDESFVDLFPEDSLSKKDQVVYKITVITSSEDDSSTDSGVFMTIYGEKGQTKKFQLIKPDEDSESLFRQGQTSEFEMELVDVGKIHKINIGQDGKGLRPMWHLDAVKILQGGSELYNFIADTTLDLSMPYIDLTPSLPEALPSSNTSKRSSMTDKLEVHETTYKVLVQYGTLQQRSLDDDDDDDDDESQLHMVIFGSNGQTKRMVLRKNLAGEIDLQAFDVGQITKITLEQNGGKHTKASDLDRIIIKRGDETTIFNIKRTIEPNVELEFTPSSDDPPVDESTLTSTSDVERKDAVYKIKVGTGERTFHGTVNIKIRGEHGIVIIPLETTKSGATPFQSKATDEFTSRTTDVGRIKRITIECSGLDKKNSWHLRRIQITKGEEVYNFLSNIRFNTKEQKLTLQPLDQYPQDYVQNELRRLKEKIREQSTKLHRPKHRAHEPYVYNDLGPYFDTSGVNKALDGPLEIPSGYYTRVTALRVVEPWEAYGMDYGVTYELLKPRRNRSHSSKRSSSTQNGMLMLPPLSLPYGGQITSVTSTRRSSSSSRRQTSSQHNGQYLQTAT
ncbi:unnamed protein product [Adineta ricciae]|uniref:PLAT domain-containing protein n=1 Tax=Adineta ricciae TaxID=249248 RepID=A0A814B8Q8_ADIRI|nr:unnamed protein product [Adineta ricciae]